MCQDGERRDVPVVVAGRVVPIAVTATTIRAVARVAARKEHPDAMHRIAYKYDVRRGLRPPSPLGGF